MNAVAVALFRDNFAISTPRPPVEATPPGASSERDDSPLDYLPAIGTYREELAFQRGYAAAQSAAASCERQRTDAISAALSELLTNQVTRIDQTMQTVSNDLAAVMVSTLMALLPSLCTARLGQELAVMLQTLMRGGDGPGQISITHSPQLRRIAPGVLAALPDHMKDRVNFHEHLDAQDDDLVIDWGLGKATRNPSLIRAEIQSAFERLGLLDPTPANMPVLPRHPIPHDQMDPAHA